MKAIMILSSYLYLWKLKHKKDFIIACPGKFTFPCSLLRLNSPFLRVLISPEIMNIIILFNSLTCYLYFPWL